MLSQREKWNRLASTWYEAGPPSTPSRMDLQIYREVTERERPDGTIILGCTPSLRRLLGSATGATPLMVVDFSEMMFNVTSAIVSPTWPEQFICADWCEDWPGVAAVDLILADRALDNVELGRRKAFFGAVQSHCRSGGLFVCHTAVEDNVLQRRSAKDLVEMWCGEWYAGVSLQDCVDGLWDDLLSIGVGRGENGSSLSVGRLWPTLSTIMAARPSGAEEVLITEMERRYRFSREAEWFTGTIDEITKLADPWFTLEDTRWASDFRAAQHHPFLLLRRR
jgi:hypothetical protein